MPRTTQREPRIRARLPDPETPVATLTGAEYMAVERGLETLRAIFSAVWKRVENPPNRLPPYDFDETVEIIFKALHRDAELRAKQDWQRCKRMDRTLEELDEHKRTIAKNQAAMRAAWGLDGGEGEPA